MNIPSHLERYSPDLDTPHKGEKETADAIAKTMIEIADKTFADGGHALRSVMQRAMVFSRGRSRSCQDCQLRLRKGCSQSPRHTPQSCDFRPSQATCWTIQSRRPEDWPSRSSALRGGVSKARKSSPIRTSFW